MKILVTGGAGFIGSNFVRMFADKYDIIVLDKLTYAGNKENISGVNCEFIQGDICDAGVVEESMKGCSGVIHFAAESHVDNSLKDASSFVNTNYYGTYIMLEIAKKLGIKKFVFISTDEVYGSISEGSFSEKDKLNPTNPYSASKSAADILCQSYFKTFNMPIMITRSSNNFGPYQHIEKFIPLFITNLLSDEKVPLYGNGSNIRDWLYVKDNCAAIEFLMRKGEIGEVYNIGGGNEKSNIEITKFILNELGKDESYINYVEDRLAHDFRYSLDCSKLLSLGFKHSYDFGSAIKETIKWYRENKNWWLK